MEAPLQHETFASNLNTTFQVSTDNAETIAATLVEVSELTLSARQERFAIVFRLPNEPFLGQGMRRLQHESMGEMELFLVPISSDDEGTCYEAVFNRMVTNT